MISFPSFKSTRSDARLLDILELHHVARMHNASIIKPGAAFIPIPIKTKKLVLGRLQPLVVEGRNMLLEGLKT